jgi:hypothetical protein
MQLGYEAPAHVRSVIAALRRTEDVKFSPSNRRLGIAGYAANKVAIFDICIATSPNGPKVAITDVVEISSPYLDRPHGIDFFDEETIIVANRYGDAPIFRLPSKAVAGACHEVAPLEVLRAANVLNGPGSVSVTKRHENLFETLICNNYGHYVSRHLMDLSSGCAVKSSDIFIKRWLDIPDGVCVSREMQWIAVSNHSMHAVLLYENTPSLNELSDPDGMLRCVYYPHGLKFTSDGRFIFVADAGAPFVHIYGQDGSSWRGVHKPLASFRVLNDEDFLRGRHNPREGGPKGIDIDAGMTIFVTTCEVQRLAFFDLAAILKEAPLQKYLQGNGAHPSGNEAGTQFDGLDEGHLRSQKELEMKYELDIFSQDRERAKAELALLTNSRSWRMTAPIRWALSSLGRT